MILSGSRAQHADAYAPVGLHDANQPANIAAPSSVKLPAARQHLLDAPQGRGRRCFCRKTGYPARPEVALFLSL